VPLTGSFLSRPTQLALILFLLFGFNLSRGISSAAWLPWITTLVPVEIRGKYLAREAVSVHVASCAAMMLSAFCLGQQSQPWQFALLFGFSGVAGAIRFGMLVDGDLHFPRLLAELHKSDIDRNAREPGGEASAAFEILQMNKCELESFLHNVFSVFVVSHNALCEVKNPPLVAIEELAKGDRMAAFRSGQQPRVTARPSFQFGSPLVALEGGSIKHLD